MDSIVNISLTHELEDYVSNQVKSGHYTSASEVIREALRNQIRHSMNNQLDQRIAASRQQVTDRQILRADDAWFDNKREMVRSRFTDD